MDKIKAKYIKKLYEKIEKLPLCYNDGYQHQGDDFDENSFIQGEAHMKEHIIELLGFKEDNDEKMRKYRRLLAGKGEGIVKLPKEFKVKYKK